MTPGCLKLAISPFPFSATGVSSSFSQKRLPSSTPAYSQFSPASAHSPQASHFLPHGHPQTVSQPKKLISHPATKSPPPPPHPPALSASCPFRSLDDTLIHTPSEHHSLAPPGPQMACCSNGNETPSSTELPSLFLLSLNAQVQGEEDTADF